jgi:outer membrane protein assembly factor BamA
LFDRQLFVDGSAAVSWHLYKMVQGTIEAPSLANDRVTVGVQGMWQDQTQVNYFGVGADSLEDDRSQYQIKTTDVVGYATLRGNEWLSVDGWFGWLYHPKLEGAGGSFIPDLPNTLVLFAGQPGTTGTQPNFLYSAAAVSADTRDYKGHPTSGGLYRVALTSYSDQHDGHFSFTEYQAEALQLLPVVGQRWILAFRGWMVLTGVPDGHDVPIYLQPSIGGNNTLRAYRSYRFHDQNALTVNGESRWALFDHVDLAAFFDAGNVAPRASDLDLAKTAYGVGLRLHTTRTTLARVDVATGAEGWHVVFRTSDPLRLGRVSRRIANVPFAP